MKTLVAGSGVNAIDISMPSQDTPEVLRQRILCAVTKDGTVELFPQPFEEPKAVNGDLKASRKQLTKKASASVRLIAPDSKTKHVPVVAAFFHGHDLIIVSADNGVDLAFQKIRWQDEGNGELLFDGLKEVVAAKSSSTLNTASLNGAKSQNKTHLDESTTLVVNGGAAGSGITEAITIPDSDEEDEEEDDYESSDRVAVKSEDDQELEAEAGLDDSDEEMVDADQTADQALDEVGSDADEKAEPSFGEMLASKHPTEISIASALPADAAALALATKSTQMAIPSGMSLATVLSQSLRTNDTPLLEACLHADDTSIIQGTIQRLDSSLAGLLLSKLAERLASRPGRYGHLITWVQSTFICHGAIIASQPDSIAKLQPLYAVLNSKMKTLDHLLLLKGKLDMLDAQLKWRKEIAARRQILGGREARDEPGTIYIEGADNWDSDDDLDEDISHPAKKARKSKRNLDDLVGDSDDDEDMDEEDIILANGADDPSSSDDDDDEDDEDDDRDAPNGVNFVDDEAEEDSDPDDVGPSPVASESSSASSDSEDEDSEADQEEDEDEDEDDSELASFINDGSVDFEEENGDEVRVTGDESTDEDDQGDDKDNGDEEP